MADHLAVSHLEWSKLLVDGVSVRTLLLLPIKLSCCQQGIVVGEKLKEDVDLTTIEWIGERLAETGPHGQQYMKKWREQWKRMLEHAEQGGTF